MHYIILLRDILKEDSYAKCYKNDGSNKTLDIYDTMLKEKGR